MFYQKELCARNILTISFSLFTAILDIPLVWNNSWYTNQHDNKSYQSRNSHLHKLGISENQSKISISIQALRNSFLTNSFSIVSAQWFWDRALWIKERIIYNSSVKPAFWIIFCRFSNRKENAVQRSHSLNPLWLFSPYLPTF